MCTLLNEGGNSCARSLGGTITCSPDGSAPSAVRPQGQQLAQRDFEKRRLRAPAPFELNQPKKKKERERGGREAQLEYEAKRKYSWCLGGKSNNKLTARRSISAARRRSFHCQVLFYHSSVQARQ